MLELQGRWQEALASRERAAAAFTAAQAPAEAAAERLAAAAHLRSAGSFRAALSLLETAGEQARAAQRVDLQARILGHEGNARARMGQGQQGVELVRAGLAMAPEHGLAGPAAEIYQRLADALEHAGDYAGASATYDEAYNFCSANGLEPTARLCLACLTAVLRQSGDWERAATLCQRVIESSDATLHARAVATGMLGSILGVRGRTRQVRPLLLESATLARQLELAAMELLSSWGLAIVDSVEGATQSAVGHCWALLERWKQTEDRHYAMPPLRWATTFFAESGGPEVLGPAPPRSPRSPRMPVRTRRCPRFRTDWGKRRSLMEASIRPPNSSPGRSCCKATTHHSNGRSHSDGWRACLSRPAVATRQSSISSPRTGQLAASARSHSQLAGALSALGERAERRLSKRSAAQLDHRGLTRRELEILRMVATGRTNREIARELFLSPRTVDMHVSSILAKLDGRSRTDAVRRASELGLLTQRSG